MEEKIIMDTNEQVEKVSPYGLSAFQLKALDLLTFEAARNAQWYFNATFDIVLDAKHADLGHQIKISFLNSDGRIWINAESYTIESSLLKRMNDELIDYDSLAGFLESFRKEIQDVFVPVA